MNLHNLFEDDNSTPNPNYAEELAYQIFKVAPELDTTGAADEVLDYAYDLVVNDFGKTKANALFAYDEDFDSDLVNAYLDLQMNQQAVDEGGPYDLPGIDYPRPGDTPTKPRQRGQSSPGVNPDDEDYFREIFRKKREAAKKAERAADHDRLATGTNEGEMDEGQQWPDSSNSLAKRKPVAAFNNQGVKAGRPGGMTVATRVDPTITSTSVQRKNDRPIPTFLQKDVAEADKKKDDDLGSEIRDVGLQRAITRAKSDFPTAGSGIEALAKDFMRSQEQDKQDFEKIRAADKDQERMLAQIAQVDQNQTQEIDNLEQDNTTLKRRLQQIQSVNARLEKTLASMSGRKKEKTTPADTGAGSFSTSASIPDAPATATPQTKTTSKTKAKTSAKAQPATSKAIGQIAKTLSPPAPSAAIDQMAQQLQPRQKELDFDNNPVTLKPKKFDTSRATDVVARQPGEVAKDVSKNIGAYGARLSGADRAFNPDAIRNLVAQDEIPMENNKEAKYSDKYQDMVARVGQKAREQEKSKPVDIKDLARRLAAIDARDKVAK